MAKVTPLGLMVAAIFLVVFIIMIISSFIPKTSNTSSEPTRRMMDYSTNKGEGFVRFRSSSPTAEAPLINAVKHPQWPVNFEQLKAWWMDGGVCWLKPLTKAWRAPGHAPSNAVSIQVAEGLCKGRTGWIPQDAWN